MANKHRGYVEVELGGEVRRLKYDLNALAELEDALGYPVTQLRDDRIGVRELRALVWAGLLHEEPKLTLKAAGSMIELDRIEEITKAVTEALERAFGQKGNGGKSVAANGTGQS